VPGIIEFLGYDPYSAPTSLSERMLAARRKLGLSRRKLAARLAMDEETLARWERGTRCPRGRWLAAVEGFLSDL
jgi:DNA-binding transcriptional regulator YiaG